MAHFQTEKETEASLARETRILSMPDGTTPSHTAFVITWESFDSLIELSGYTEPEIIRLSLEEVRLQGFAFGRAFDGMVAWLFHRRRSFWTGG